MLRIRSFRATPKLAAEFTEPLIEESVEALWTLAREARRWLRSARQTEVDPPDRWHDREPRQSERVSKLRCEVRLLLSAHISNEETRIAQLMQQQKEIANDGSSGEGDAEDKDSMRLRRSRDQLQTDMMKDARELLKWKEGREALAIRLRLALDGSNRPA